MKWSVNNFMKKKTFMLNALLLTCASLINMSIGMFFRIYMSNKVGAEGIGLYQLITAIYFFAATFSTTGISLTVTRLVTDFLAKEEYAKAKNVIIKCLILGIFISIVAGSIMFIFADQIGTYVLKDHRSVLSLKILAPSLPFVAISSCFRGYFYAVRRVIKTVSEQLFEQIIEIIVFIILIGKLAPLGIEYACAAIVIGTSVSEFFSCIYSYILYIYDIKKFSITRKLKSQLSSKIIFIFLPLTASASLRAGLSTVENVMIPSGLKRFGASGTKALSTYGMIVGMVMPIITFPTLFLLSFSMLLIPEMSEANAVHHKKNINHMAAKVLKITLLFSIMTMNIFLFFSKDLGISIYSSSECGTYLSLLSPLVPLMYLDKVVDGMLKGLNQQLHYLSYNIIDSVVRIILIFILLPVIGINGLIIMMFTSTILNSTLSIARLLKVTELKLNLMDWIIRPLICSSFSSIFTMLITSNCPINSIFIKTCFEVIFSTMLYIITLFLTGTIKSSDIKWIKNTIHT